MTKNEALAQLAELNPKIKRDRLCIYVDALLLYREASENIERNGAITAHPRTGAPLENPYLKVRKMASDTIAKMHNINPGSLWD